MPPNPFTSYNIAALPGDTWFSFRAYPVFLAVQDWRRSQGKAVQVFRKRNLVRFPTADTIRKRLAENPRASQRVRLQALEAILDPPLSVLTRLLANPETPTRLLGVAATRYETALLTRRKKPVQKTEKS